MSFADILTTLDAPREWFLGLSPYISMTIVGLIIAGFLTCAGFILARMGYKPLWAILLLLPFGLDAMALWVLAYKKFPREKL